MLKYRLLQHLSKFPVWITWAAQICWTSSVGCVPLLLSEGKRRCQLSHVWCNLNFIWQNDSPANSWNGLSDWSILIFFRIGCPDYHFSIQSKRNLLFISMQYLLIRTQLMWAEFQYHRRNKVRKSWNLIHGTVYRESQLYECPYSLSLNSAEVRWRTRKKTTVKS